MLRIPPNQKNNADVGYEFIGYRMTKDYFLAKYCQHGFESHILDKSECETEKHLEVERKITIERTDGTKKEVIIERTDGTKKEVIIERTDGTKEVTIERADGTKVNLKNKKNIKLSIGNLPSLEEGRNIRT